MNHQILITLSLILANRQRKDNLTEDDFLKIKRRKVSLEYKYNLNMKIGQDKD